MSDTTEMEKLRILTMWECGKSTREIAKSINKSARTVQRWLASQKREGNMDKKPRGKRPRKTTPEEDAKIIQIAKDNPELTQKEIITICNLNIYTGTLRRRIQEANGTYGFGLFLQNEKKQKESLENPKKSTNKPRKMKEPNKMTHITLKPVQKKQKTKEPHETITPIDPLSDLNQEITINSNNNTELQENSEEFTENDNFQLYVDENMANNENVDLFPTNIYDNFQASGANVKVEMLEPISNENDTTEEVYINNQGDSDNTTDDINENDVTKEELCNNDKNNQNEEEEELIPNNHEEKPAPKKVEKLALKVENIIKTPPKRRERKAKHDKILQDSQIDPKEAKKNEKPTNTKKRKVKTEVNYRENENATITQKQTRKRERKRKNPSEIKEDAEKPKRRKRRSKEEITEWEKDNKDTTDLEKKKMLIMAECGMTTEDIARYFRKSRRTVQRWLSKHQKGLDLEKKERGRRPRKTTREEDAKIIQLVKENPNLTRDEILKLAGIHLHKATLTHRLNEAGIFFNNQGVKILDFTEKVDGKRKGTKKKTNKLMTFSGQDTTNNQEGTQMCSYVQLHTLLGDNPVEINNFETENPERNDDVEHVECDAEVNEGTTIITCTSSTPTPAITNAILACQSLSTTLIITNDEQEENTVAGNSGNNQQGQFRNVGDVAGNLEQGAAERSEFQNYF